MMRICFKHGMSVSEFWQCTYRDIFNFVKAHNDDRADKIEQAWDYVRHIMWSNMQPNSTKEIKVSRIIRLKRDGAMIPEISTYDQQELDRWSDDCDAEMNLVDWDGNPIN